MASRTEIANMALGFIGIGLTISNLDSESSAEARACRRYYDTARDMCLRRYPWQFATTILALGLIEEDPNEEWGYSYQVPSDCVKFIRIIPVQRNETRQSRVPFKLAYGVSGTVVFSDLVDAEAEYVVRVDDPSRYPAEFSIAMAYVLASLIAPSLTRGDPFKLGDLALQKGDMYMRAAQTNSANEEQPDDLPDSEFIRARE